MSTFIRSYTEGRAEQGVSVKNAQIFRKIKDNNWTKLRLAVRYSFYDDPGYAALSGALFAYGLCSGNTNGLADETTTHFLGYGNWISTGSILAMAYSTGAGYFGNRPSGTSTYFGQIENNAWKSSGIITALTSQPNHVGPPNGAGAWAVNVHAFDIEKQGGTTYKVLTKCMRTAVTDLDVTAATFEAQVEAASLSIPAHASYTPGTTTCTVDEATYGTLDHFNLWWNRSNPQMFVHDVAVVRLA